MRRPEARQDAAVGLKELLRIIAVLRSRKGCPWDREQTLRSLKPHLLEECYELLDAMDSRDPARHREELGDVLLQVVLHAQIRRERKEFGFGDVVNELTRKLVRRHPHVFGGVQVRGAADVLRNWETIKAREGRRRPSAVDGVPRYLPALHRAQKVQQRAARVGFDWKRVSDIEAKVAEELREFRTARLRKHRTRVREEIGDLLFAVVNLARFLRIGAEDALDGAVDKFNRRFRDMEHRLKLQGRTISDCSLEEMDTLWEAAKRSESRRARSSARR